MFYMFSELYSILKYEFDFEELIKNQILYVL